MSASSQSLRFILSLSLYSSIITSRPGPIWRGRHVGCCQSGAGPVGAGAWPAGDRLWLARVRVSRVTFRVQARVYVRAWVRVNT